MSRKKPRKREARVPATRRPAASSRPKPPDRRGVSSPVTEIGGVPVSSETFIRIVEPIRLASGDIFNFESPYAPTFYLLSAKEHRDRAEPMRVRAITKTRRDEGELSPVDATGAFEALKDLATAVILSAAAIEAHANDMIRRLPEKASVEVKRKSMRVVYERDSMERSLNLEEKVTLVAPMLTGDDSIKGTKAWEAYKRVIPLRNELTHVKPRVQNNPDDPGPFGRLMLGEGSRAPEDAAAVIHAVEPHHPAHVWPDLGILESPSPSSGATTIYAVEARSIPHGRSKPTSP
jgi:hypothetical protein